VFRVAPYSSEELFEIDDDDVVSPESETEEEDIRPVAVESIKPKRILVVDDEQFMLQFLQGVLEEEGVSH
jgi:PleD family two-component response regulator